MAYCIVTVSESGQGEIESIFVEQNYRGMGVGNHLMQMALAWIREAGFSSVKFTDAYDATLFHPLEPLEITDRGFLVYGQAGVGRRGGVTLFSVSHLSRVNAGQSHVPRPVCT